MNDKNWHYQDWCLYGNELMILLSVLGVFLFSITNFVYLLFLVDYTQESRDCQLFGVLEGDYLDVIHT